MASVADAEYTLGARVHLVCTFMYSRGRRRPAGIVTYTATHFVARTLHICNGALLRIAQSQQRWRHESLQSRVRRRRPRAQQPSRVAVLRAGVVVLNVLAQLQSDSGAKCRACASCARVGRRLDKQRETEKNGAAYRRRMIEATFGIDTQLGRTEGDA